MTYNLRSTRNDQYPFIDFGELISQQHPNRDRDYLAIVACPHQHRQVFVDHIPLSYYIKSDWLLFENLPPHHAAFIGVPYFVIPAEVVGRIRRLFQLPDHAPDNFRVCYGHLFLDRKQRNIRIRIRDRDGNIEFQHFL